MDLADEFRAAMGVFLAATAAVVLAMFAVFFGSLAIVALFWDEHGIASVVYVSAAYAIAAILIALLVRRFLDHKRPFLAATLEELDKDRQRIGLR